VIRINRQTDYAARVILALSRRKPEGRVSSAEIQREMLIPPALARRIIADLAHGGFILTHPGREGGLTLARPATEINLRQVVEHFEGKLFLSECLIAQGECPFDDKCPVRCRWARLQNMILREMEQITFAELAEDASALEGLAENIARPEEIGENNTRVSERSRPAA